VRHCANIGCSIFDHGPPIKTTRFKKIELNLRFIHAVLESNNIYHRRWGDAPLRFLQVQMFYSNDEVDTVVTYPLHEV
jgi:hypothetical protein